MEIYEGAYLAFPRWGVGLDLPDNSVCIADSKSLHGVTPIRGTGKRYTTVSYTDLSVATIPPLGKPEQFIGKLKSDDEDIPIPEYEPSSITGNSPHYIGVTKTTP